MHLLKRGAEKPSFNLIVKKFGSAAMSKKEIKKKKKAGKNINKAIEKELNKTEKEVDMRNWIQTFINLGIVTVAIIGFIFTTGTQYERINNGLKVTAKGIESIKSDTKEIKENYHKLDKRVALSNGAIKSNKEQINTIVKTMLEKSSKR